MKGMLGTAICISFLGSGLEYAFAAQTEAGFWGSLSEAFSEMGRNFTRTINSQSQPDDGVNKVGKAIANTPESPGGVQLQGRQLVYEIQYRLSALGYSPGPVDGLMGKKTAAAISTFQSSSGLPVDGHPSQQVITALRSVSSAIQLPTNIADVSAPRSNSSLPIGSALGGLASTYSSLNRNSKGGRSGMAALSGNNDNSTSGGIPLQSNDGIVAALNSLAPAAAGLSEDSSAQDQTRLIPRSVAGMSSSSGNPVAILSSIAQDIPLLREMAPSGSSIRPNGQSYLDRMVAEGDALVYRSAQVDPQTREMARRAGVDIDGAIARQLTGYERYKRDAAEIERLTGGNIIANQEKALRTNANKASFGSGDSTSSTRNSRALPSVLAGSWEGMVSYEPHRISSTRPLSDGQQMRVRLDVDTRRGLIAVRYPDLGCSGILRANLSTPAKAGTNQHEIIDYPLEEYLANSSERCTDRGRVFLSHLSAYQPHPVPRKGQLWFRWVNPTTQKNGMFGILRPVSNVVDSKTIDEMMRLSTITEAVDRDPQKRVKDVAKVFGDRGVTLDEVELLVEAAPYAMLSEHVYDENWKKGEFFSGWKIVDVDKRRFMYARAYERGNEVVIAFQGTNFKDSFWNGLGDLIIVDMVGTLVTGNFEDLYAKQFIEKVINDFPRSTIIVTGHSMGGRLAQVALLVNRDITKAYTFNSAPLSLPSRIINKYQQQDLDRAKSNIVAIRESDDILENLAKWNVGHYADVDFIKRNTLTWLADTPKLFDNHKITIMAEGLHCIAENYSTGGCN